jgi:hypothetical protein
MARKPWSPFPSAALLLTPFVLMFLTGGCSSDPVSPADPPACILQAPAPGGLDRLEPHGTGNPLAHPGGFPRAERLGPRVPDLSNQMRESAQGTVPL